MSNKSTLAAVLTAIAAGAALGVLFAPDSGAKTRKKLVQKGHDLGDKLSELLNEGKTLVDELKGEVEDKASNLKRKAEDVKDRVKDVAYETSNSARAAANK
ncbi:MAG: YtxH domain-containing protein [Flavobacteriales bacterium]